MNHSIPTCILLTSDNEFLARSALAFASSLFDVKYRSMQSRKQKKLPPEFYDVLKNGRIDYLFNFLSPVILKKDVLEPIRIASINFHPAPPEWPGIGSASFAIYENENFFGVTAHHLTEEIDAGQIINVLRFPILPSETCDRLFDRALIYCLILFYDVLYEIESTGKIPVSEETWKRKAVTRKQFEKWMILHPHDSAEEIQRKVRALQHNRFPGPFIEIAGFRFELPPREEDEFGTK